MTRNAVRSYLVVGCLVALSLLYLFLPTQAAQQPAGVDPQLLDSFVARSIGPANMSGRIVQIAGVESNPKIIYVATASGGLVKTSDGGDSWEMLFDKENSVSIGDVAVAKSNPNIVWVGTGEHNVRNSVAWGDGVYKSTDGGKTWQNMGLKDSHSIGRIAIHPEDPNIVYVAVLGHIWGPNKTRGIFKTMDGGKTWEVSKFIDEDTGFIDLQMDPTDPNTLYGSAYRFRRDAFSGSDNPSVFFLGPKAGLYKTSDGGKNWEHLTVATPTSQYGRCGIDIYRKNPNVIFAVVQTEKTPVGEANQGGANGAGNRPELGGVYRSDDKGKTWKHLNTLCTRPFYFGQIRVDPKDDNRVYVMGVSLFTSNDGGKTFPGGGKGKGEGEGDDPDAGKGGLTLTSFQQDPQKKDDPKKDDPKKDDPKKDQQKKGGKGGGGKGGGTIHADLHAMWINPNNPNEVWLGTDGGFGVSRNRAQSFQAMHVADLGQFYGISVDMRKPYYVYGGLQDNGNWGGPSATHEEIGIRQALWTTIGIGGDGFHTANDPTDWTIVYGESQYGNFGRATAVGAGKGGKGKKKDEPAPKKDEPAKGDPKKDEQKKDEQKKDEPKNDEPQKKGGKGGKGGGNPVKGLGAVRFNWSSPLVLSPLDPKTIFYGGEALLMSGDRGKSFKKISPDLTYGPDKGGKMSQGRNWAHTLFTINESPKKKDVIWTGADDGRIMVTPDGGKTWNDVSKLPGMPKEGCVSRVEPSYFEDGGCYVSITRYRNDDRKPYVFKTSDYGKTWTNITSNLPQDASVHVVIQSSKNKNLLFCGTEYGLFVSINDGQSWQRMEAGFPTVAVHDLVIHPRDRDLVIGTHGRSIYVIDDIGPLEQLTPEVVNKNAAHIFDIRPAVAFKWKAAAGGVDEGIDLHPFPDELTALQKNAQGKTNVFVGQNPPYGAIIRYRFKNPNAMPATMSIVDAAGKKLATIPTSNAVGLHQVVWNLRADGQKETVPPGEYSAVLDSGAQRQVQKFRVVAE